MCNVLQSLSRDWTAGSEVLLKAQLQLVEKEQVVGKCWWE